MINVIPKPKNVQLGEGVFWLNTGTIIMVDPELQRVADSLARPLRQATTLPLLIMIDEGDTACSREDVAAVANTVHLTTHNPPNGLGAEGYHLAVTPERVLVQAETAQGLFYGVQTLCQLLPLESDGVDGKDVWGLTAVTITDSPQYSWRGLHLDVGRHMYPVSFIKRFIDLMVSYKYNIFHWHLTEDQGWRIEIKQYPKLTEIGSKRAATPYPADRTSLDGKPYGGFYTQDEVREVVAYARERFITVVPEIEMPGHAVAALTSYPHLGCVGEGYSVRTFWGIDKDVFCAGNEDVFTFLENVLTELFDLFPSEYIHIGGDECPKDRWQVCPKCQARIAEEGLADEYALQSYFVQRMERFLNVNGRRLIGWDEILEGGLAPNATVMSWRGFQGGIDAATAGHDVVMAPNTYCYLDYYQSEDKENEPPAIGGYVPLEKVYQFDPIAGIPPDKTSYVLGGQGNVWTEYMPTPEQVEYMVYPRALALAEAVWTANSQREYADFLKRIKPHMARLARLGVNYRPLEMGIN